MSSRYYARDHAGKNQARRTLNVNVTVERGSRPTNAGRTAGFWAHACVGSTKARMRYKKCGPAEFARTPTAALKKALVALGRSKEVR